jgi:hypothetical protein
LLPLGSDDFLGVLVFFALSLHTQMVLSSRHF